MRNLAWMCLLGTILFAQAVPAAPEPDKISLSAIQTAVLSNDGSGATRVALRFELTGLRQGEGRRIEEAFLELSVPGVPADRTTEYLAYPVTAEWVRDTGIGMTSVRVGSEPAAFWEISPADHAAGQGNRIRMDLQPLVQAWSDGTSKNFGVVLSTKDLIPPALAAQMWNTRLVVRFGFSGAD